MSYNSNCLCRVSSVYRSRHIMVFSCSAVSGYFSSRPPVTIFLVSLLTLSVALLVLAGYSHYKTDLEDEVLDWARLLREMSQLKFCLGNSSWPAESSPGSVVTASLDGVPVSGEEDFSSTGVLPLSLLGLLSPHNVSVSLQVKAGQACVMVEAAELHLVSHLRNETVGSSSCWDNKRELRRWTAHRRQHLPHNWCQQPGEPTDIHFGTVAGLETFLTQDQRDVMYYHLTATSLILMVLCLLVVLWAGIRRDPRQSLTLLPTSDSEDM